MGRARRDRKGIPGAANEEEASGTGGQAAGSDRWRLALNAKATGCGFYRVHGRKP